MMDAAAFAFPHRVLLLNPVAEFGGAERVLMDFIASTREAKPDLAFHLVTFSDGPLLAAVQRLGATASVLPLPRRLRGLGDSGLLTGPSMARRAQLLLSLALSMPALLRFLRSLNKEIVRRLPDIVHTNGIKAHLLASIVTPRSIPLVWHLHDFIGERPLVGRLMGATAYRVHAAVAVSEVVAQDARRRFRALPIRTILNAVDVGEFSPGPNDGPSLDRLAMMPPASLGALRVGLVATYARWKGHDVFLRAAARVRAACPTKDVRFYLIGGRVYDTNDQFTEDELRALISKLEITEFAGLIPFQTNLAPILRSLDVVVHASTRPEPFGRAIIEAMACARPIVAARAGAVAEIVEHGRSALLHEPGNVTSLESAILLLLNDDSLRSRIASEGHRRVLSSFSRSRLGPALLEVYGKLTRQKRYP